MDNKYDMTDDEFRYFFNLEPKDPTRKYVFAVFKRYKKLHPKEYREYQNRYCREKRKKDVGFRIANNLRSRVYIVLKGKNKSEHTLKLLGCSLNKLKEHLESQFKQGMTWKNYGLWHIDHIKPCAKFDLSKPEEQKKCFHYTNLQPLWAEDNLKKGKKYNKEVLI